MFQYPTKGIVDDWILFLSEKPDFRWVSNVDLRDCYLSRLKKETLRRFPNLCAVGVDHAHARKMPSEGAVGGEVEERTASGSSLDFFRNPVVGQAVEVNLRGVLNA